jgi:hypothetical protein
MCLQHRPDTARAQNRRRTAGRRVPLSPPRRAPQPRSCRLRPIRARVTHQRARLGRSERYGETDSGAVSAGSSRGIGQRNKFEHSDNPKPESSQVGDLRQCSAPPDIAPDTRPKNRHRPGKGLLSTSGDNSCQAVAVTADRCSSQYPQLRSGSVGTVRARLSSPPDRLDATWPTSHSVISPSIFFARPAAVIRGRAVSDGRR